MKVDQILAYVDIHTESEQLFRRIDWLSELFDARVTLIGCAFDKFVDSEQGKSNVSNELESELEKLAGSRSARSEPFAIEVFWSKKPDAAILNAVEKHRPDLVVKQTHDQSVLERVFFTDEDWNLILHCPTALLLTKNRPMPARPVVMAAVDPLHDHDKPASLDKRILDVATALSTGNPPSLHAAHVVDTAASFVASSAFAPHASAVTAPVATEPAVAEATRAELVRTARQALTDLLEEYADTVQPHLLEGDVATKLLALAEDLHTDIVAMGCVSRGMLRNAVIGHTAKRVLDELTCDLAVVK